MTDSKEPPKVLNRTLPKGPYTNTEPDKVPLPKEGNKAPSKLERELSGQMVRLTQRFVDMSNKIFALQEHLDTLQEEHDILQGFYSKRFPEGTRKNCQKCGALLNIRDESCKNGCKNPHERG